jgi:alpha-galactosidase
VRGVADAMVAEGMVDLGYNYVNLDDCWSAKERNATGHLQAEASFPSGMAALADYVHARGLRLGVYTDVGTKTCKGDRPGSYGHYEQDAQTLAAWRAQHSIAYHTIARRVP